MNQFIVVLIFLNGEIETTHVAVTGVDANLVLNIPRKTDSGGLLQKENKYVMIT